MEVLSRQERVLPGDTYKMGRRPPPPPYCIQVGLASVGNDTVKHAAHYLG